MNQETYIQTYWIPKYHKRVFVTPTIAVNTNNAEMGTDLTNILNEYQVNNLLDLKTIIKLISQASYLPRC